MCKKNAKLRTALVNLVRALTFALILTPAISAHAAEQYQWKNAQIVGGGFIPGIVFNTGQKDLIYARTDIGGPYRWDPANRSWIPLTDSISPEDWNLMGCDALATDPIEPNRVYVLAGTYTNDWTSQNGAVLRSTDRGNTWQRTDLPFKVGGNMPGRSMGERLMIDPNKNNILYLGARSGNGLWKSTDYGATWTKVSAFPNPGTYAQSPGAVYGGDPMGIAWITFDKSTGSLGSATKTIYVGVADKSSSIYRSTDGGVTWAAVAGQPTGYLPHHGVLSSKGMLYVAYSDSVGPYDGVKGEVWKLNTATGAWVNISPVTSSSKDESFGYGGLAVDAQHPDTLMVATMNSWWPDANIFRSVDGGTTWTRIWEWTRYPTRSLRYTQDISASPWLNMGLPDNPPVPAVKLGWMMGSLEIDPFNSDRMMYGTGATLYGADNLTAWDKGGKVDIKVMAQGIEETAILALVSPPEGAHLLSGVGDISGFRHDDLDKVPEKVMTSPTFSSTRGMDYAELKPSFMVRVGDGDFTSGFSYDGGSTWFQGNSEPAKDKLGGSVAAAADASVVVHSIDSAGVFYSKDNGNSWTRSSGVPAKAAIASDRVNAKKFYAYVAGAVYRSTDGGASFSKAATPGIASDTGCQLKAMTGKEGDLWMACGKAGLWHSTDSGASVTKIAGVEHGHAIGFGKAAPGKTNLTLYSSAKVGQVTGIYRSVDSGASWLRINDDQHQYGVVVTVITGDPRIYGRVYIGARGVVYGDIASGSSPDLLLATIPVTGVSVSPTQLTLNSNTTGQLSATVTPSDATSKTVTWTSSNPTVVSVSSTGQVSGIGEGSAIITATATNQDGKLVSAISTITVAAASRSPDVVLTATASNGKILLSWTTTETLNNVQLMRDTDPNPMGRGRVASLISRVRSFTDKTAVNGTQYWYWIKYTDATGQIRNSNAGSATAGSNDSGNMPISVTGVTVSPSNASVSVGATTTFSAAIVPATATNKALTWRSSNTGVATVSATGVVTGVAAGNATITATSTDGNRSASSTVTVAAADSGNSDNTVNCGTAVALPFAIDGVGDFCRVTTGEISEFNSHSMQLVEINGVAFTNAYWNKWGAKLPAKVDGKYTIHYIGKYLWSHLNVEGSGGSNDNGGDTTPSNSTISAGSTSFDKNSTKQADITVTMTLNGNTLSAIKNGGAALASGTDYSVSGNTVTLLKSYLAKQAVGTLSLTFDFSAGNDPVVSLSIADTTSDGAVTGVTVTPTAVTVGAGMTTNLTATLQPQNASNKSVTWTSSDASIATVSATGVVTAVAKGSAIITVTTADGARAATCAVTVPGFTPDQPKDSTINATNTSFDKTDGKQTDIAVAMTLNGNALSAIRNGGVALAPGTDYTESGNTVTLLKSYLAKQSDGAVSLTFDFNAGKDPVLMLQIVAAVAPEPAPGIHVAGTQVLEANGKAFVMRGINVAHAWFADKTNRSLSDIAKTGANTVRIVLASGDRWTKTSESEVSGLIAQAKANKLIAILEVHDTTGYGEQAGAVTLAQAVNYWKGVKNVLAGQEDYVILNIGNEPIGNGQAASAWIDGHIDAIKSLRAAGFKHAIMVDAPNWGQDWQNVMRDNAASVLAADPQKNVIFSVHMYQVYAKASTIDSYMAAFKNKGLALVVGEFAADHQGEDVDEAAIMSYAKQYGDGYLGWSWSGNSTELVSLDIAKNFDGGNLSTWGNTLINGANGIKTTSALASIFGGVNPPAPTVPAEPTGLNATIANSIVTLTWADKSRNEQGFRVERRLSGATTWTTLTNTVANAQTYVDSTASAGSSYEYRVSAYNVTGVSAGITATAMLTPAVILPSAPSGLTSAVIDNGTVNLAWTDNSANETGFRVERRVAGDASWTMLAELAANRKAYSDTPVKMGKSYEYRVYAYNSAGSGAAATSTASLLTLVQYGEQQYKDATVTMCASCHGADGKGAFALKARTVNDFAALAQIVAGTMPDKENKLCINNCAKGTAAYIIKLKTGITLDEDGKSDGTSPVGQVCKGGELFCEDFESFKSSTATSTAWTIENDNPGNASVSINGTHARGSKALHLSTTDSGMAFLVPTKFSPPGNSFYGRMWLWIDAFPTKPDYAHFTLVEVSGTGSGTKVRPIGGQYIPGQGNGSALWGVGSDGGPTGDWTSWQTTTPTAGGKWTCMEWQMDATDNAVNVWIDGVAKPEMSVSTKKHGNGSSDFIFPTFNKIRLGWQLYQGGAMPPKYNIWLDDLTLSSTRVGCGNP